MDGRRHVKLIKVVVDPNGQFVATRPDASDFGVYIWNMDGTLQRTLDITPGPSRALAISNDGQTLAAVGSSTTGARRIELWRTADWTLQRVIPCNHELLIFSTDNQHVIAANGNGLTFFSVADGSQYRFIPASFGGWPLNGIAIHPQGQYLAVSASYTWAYGVVRLFKLADGTFVNLNPPTWARCTQSRFRLMVSWRPFIMSLTGIRGCGSGACLTANPRV
jgi:WD40 repeat protein